MKIPENYDTKLVPLQDCCFHTSKEIIWQSVGLRSSFMGRKKSTNSMSEKMVVYL